MKIEMAKHLLALEVPDITNEGIFVVDDTSIYTASLPVDCQNLQITAPGFNSPTVLIPIEKNFRLVLNACTLGIINSTGCSDGCPNLPDGIYQLYYSVAPNNLVYVSYNYLRVTKTVNRLNTFLRELQLPNCLPDRELETTLQDIDIIRNYIRSAQTNINDSCGNVIDGVNQFRFANELMEKMLSCKPMCYNR